MTVGPKTSPRRLTTAPWAMPGPHRGERVVLVGAARGQGERDLGGGGRVGDGEQDLVADGLDDPAAVVDDEAAVASCSKRSTHSTSSASSRLLALGGVADDVDEADRQLRLGVGSGELGASSSRLGGAGEVAAPDVGLQRLDPGQHVGGELGEPAVRVGALGGEAGEQAWSATPRAGRSCGPRCGPARPGSPAAEDAQLAPGRR